jgi:hypothetical protein
MIELMVYILGSLESRPLCVGVGDSQSLSMMPEAFEHGGPLVALATAVGFAGAFLLTKLTGS